MPGADVGAKIMTCAGHSVPRRALPITREALFRRSSSPSPGHNLKLGCGIHRNSFGVGPFRSSSDVTLEGSGGRTVLQQLWTAVHEQQLYDIVPINSFTAGA